MPATTLVIPCYDEEKRLPVAEVLALLANPEVRLLLVDDGSRDGTRRLLVSLAEKEPDRIDVLFLDENQGKSEAVRRGLLRALDGGARIVGYIDADMSTPADEVLRLVDVLGEMDANAVLGSRVAILGARIERRPSRHYLGRIFATAASLALRLPVYDTQCGAKVFRATPLLSRALAEPFRSRWAFDVELLHRLIPPDGDHRFVEVPLRRWRDPGGSKLSLGAMLRTGLDLGRMAIAFRKPRE